MTADTELSAGYGHRRPGVASYCGVLRTPRPARKRVWQCPHDHAVATSATRCAESELERRGQGAQTVIELMSCVPCGVYYGAGSDRNTGWAEFLSTGRCPRCMVPVSCIKVVVLPLSVARVSDNQGKAQHAR